MFFIQPVLVHTFCNSFNAINYTFIRFIVCHFAYSITVTACALVISVTELGFMLNMSFQSIRCVSISENGRTDKRIAGYDKVSNSKLLITIF